MREGQLYGVLLALRAAGPEGTTAQKLAWAADTNTLEAIVATRELIRRGLAEYVPHPGPVVKVRYIPSSIERKMSDYLGEGN